MAPIFELSTFALRLDHDFVIFLFEAPPNSAMSEDTREAMLHIAVITARPQDCAHVARRIAMLADTEVRHIQGSKIIVLLEGSELGAIGARLAEISLMDGVLSANLVFEQSVGVMDLGDEP